MPSTIRVFTARRIITMNPSWPSGNAVAVRDGRILEVGTLHSLRPWLDAHPYELDHTFSDAILMPGFIDPHLHAVQAATLLPMHFITALEWKLPGRNIPATHGHDAYVARLTEIERSLTDPAEPLFTWGYHALWHGEIRRQHLNRISRTRPMVVWQRSFHELMMNDAMLESLDITAERVRGRPQIDFENGHFFENGLGYAISRLNPILMSDAWLRGGLDQLRAVVHAGGHTTIGDMAVGIFQFEREVELIQQTFGSKEGGEDTPFRIIGVPHAVRAAPTRGNLEESRSFFDGIAARSTDRLRFPRHIKLFSDGAFFSQLSQMQEPGYIDGHHGEWLMAPDEFETITREYWHAGYRIHVHSTGDLGLQLIVDTLEKLQFERPRFRHGFTVEHFGFSTPEQVTRLRELGAQISANVYYLHELSDAYTTKGIGTERAQQMSRVGTAFAQGICTAFHTDFPMAPARPLLSAWVAATRRNCVGNVVAPDERVTIQQALEAITINAARILNIDDETGSIRAGKRADFVALDRDPFEAGADGLKDIRILGTVFEGHVHPLVSA